MLRLNHLSFDGKGTTYGAVIVTKVIWARAVSISYINYHLLDGETFIHCK